MRYVVSLTEKNHDQETAKRARMKSANVHYFNIGPRLTLTFALLIALILGGNGLLVWQFHIARLQTDRLTGVNQQVITVVRLQKSLLSFHPRLYDLAECKDPPPLVPNTHPFPKL